MAAWPARDPASIPDETLLAFLVEDMGPELIDVTSDIAFGDDPDAEGPAGSAAFVAREPCVVSGIRLATRVFEVLANARPTPGPSTTAEVRVEDGHRAQAGETIAIVKGPARTLLKAERVALNILGRMSGIATAVAAAQEAVAAVNPQCRVAGTRKTAPGFRAFEKLAIVHGGGDPHRFGLDDAAMVKDNHREADDLTTSLRRLRARYPRGQGEIAWLEVEVEDLDAARTAVDAGAEWILIDNKDPEAFASMATAIRAMDPNVRIEASGGITPETAPRYALAADRISMGSLTQSVRIVDIGLDWLA